MAISKGIKNRLLLALIILVCLLSLGLVVYSQPSESQPDLVLTILHTNDLHAHDEPFIEHGQDIGGMPRIGHLIRTIRKNTPNVLVIDAGDIFQGTPFFKFYHGAVEVALLNMVGYDIYTPGNHEFDDGPENLAKQLQAAKFDIISANMDASGVPELARLIKPAVVKTIEGRKVGFVGAICPDLEQVSLTTGKVRVKESGDNWIKPIKQEVDKLKAEGISRIILVTHVGVERDKQLAESIPEVDAIIGGHSHTRLDKPIIVKHEDGTETVIVQTGCYGRTLGKLKLAFDQQGHVIPEDVEEHLINIGDRIYQDSDITTYLAEKEGPVRELRSKSVGVALGDFENRFSLYPWDSPLGDLICDALADAGTAYGANISFENRGGIRGRIEKGPINMETVEDILPFENHVTFATIPGKTLLKVLEHSTSRNLGGPFFDVHGLKLAYDSTKPPGSRVVYAMAQDERGRWHDIDPESRYKIAVNDYSFNSGEGYDFSSATNILSTKERLAAVLADYLTKQKEIKPESPSRIVPVTDHLLSVVKHGGKQVLQVQSGIPGARLTLVTGSWPGVENISGPAPVPLTNPHVIDADEVADESGEFSWQLPLKQPASIGGKHAGHGGAGTFPNEQKWAAVIVQPPGHGQGQVKISYPVPLNGEAMTTRAVP
jgi:5'-nucleotidase